MGNTTNSSLLPYHRSQTKSAKEMMIQSTNYEWQYMDIYLDLSERGLGISIRGGIDSPNHAGFHDIYISRILEAGAVARDGRIQLGKIYLFKFKFLKNEFILIHKHRRCDCQSEWRIIRKCYT